MFANLASGEQRIGDVLVHEFRQIGIEFPKFGISQIRISGIRISGFPIGIREIRLEVGSGEFFYQDSVHFLQVFALVRGAGTRT